MYIEYTLDFNIDLYKTFHPDLLIKAIFSIAFIAIGFDSLQTHFAKCSNMFRKSGNVLLNKYKYIELKKYKFLYNL